MIRRTFVIFNLAVALTMPAAAAEFPDHPVKLIVPTAPGGVNDIVARLIQPGLTAALRQPIVVENKSGANNIIGTNFVAKSPPDGYTLVVVPASHAVNPAVQANMPFDTEKDLTPIILIGKNPMMFPVNPQVPATTLQEFSALAKANPNRFSFATPGMASQAHLVIAQWAIMAGVEARTSPTVAARRRCLQRLAGRFSSP
jgi:tripartite-type tricarboxylate transporter receptor subunit TctC